MLVPFIIFWSQIEDRAGYVLPWKNVAFAKVCGEMLLVLSLMTLMLIHG